MNNINRGKVALGISLKVFEELLQELQEQNLFGKLNTEQSFPIIEGNDALTITAIVNVDLFPIKFRLQTRNNGSLYTRLEIAGRAKLIVASPTAESPNLFDLPFSIYLNMGLALKTRNNKAPVLTFQYNGIDSMTGPFPEEKVSELIESPEFTQLLNNFELDVIDPAIAGLEEVLFLNETKPNRADWQVGLHLMNGVGNNVDAVALIVDVPGGNATAPAGGSFVPNRSEIIVQFTDSMVLAMVDEAKEELKSWFESIKGVDIRVSRLELTVDNNQLYLDAKIVEKEYDATVTIKGPVYFRHTPGGMFIALDIKDVDTDIDLPWWADVLAWFLDIISFGLAGINDTVHNKIPNFAQSYAQRTLDDMLPKLGEALSFDSLSVQNVNLEIYPDEIALDDGAITVYLQVLIKKLREDLLRADYSSLRERFVMAHLVSGRRYLVEHLASFMKRGLVEVPGYHDIDGRFIRSNPDNTENNNLLERYGR